MDTNNNYLIDEFLMQCPIDRDMIVRHYMFSETELVVVLKDGRSVLYDWMEGTYRFFVKTKCIDNEDAWRLEFARRLYKKMTARGMSQNTLAELSGISFITISKYMNGKSTPSLFNAEKLANALKCSVGELINFPTRM